MHPELILIACAVLAAILVPSLITVRPRYFPEDDQFTVSATPSGQPAE